jgi:sialate O-acetylesterase
MNINFVLPAIGCLLLDVAFAEVRPNPLFSDHAVLQQNADVPVWGTARDGESVSVEFQDQKAVATAVAGKWMVNLKNLKPGGPFTMTLKGDNTVVLLDLLVGEVWLCSGQSNMEWALSKSDGGAEAIAGSTNPMLRMCRVPHNVQMTPQAEVKLKWEESNPASAKSFSAIPYWFGCRLQKELGVPVGIINNSFGGTTIQSWMPAETLKNGPWPQDRWTDMALAKADHDVKFEAARDLRERFEADKADALARKLPPPPSPPGIPSEFKGPVTLWNGEIAPLLPYRIRAVAWYQGESNAYVNVATSYKDLLPAMIRDWRTGFQQPDLPFLIFQIARNRKWQTDPNERSGIAELQEIQSKTALSTPSAALVVTTDMGGPDVHYTGKQPVADRAVKVALSLAYGRDERCSGLLVRTSEFRNGRAFIRFAHAEGGLEARGGELEGFVIAGSDRKFFFADAKIEGDVVVVHSPQVPKPVSVRYGWADLPKVNLFNKEGFPASPFRTDEWPLY